jgi:hypothetical protein
MIILKFGSYLTFPKFEKILAFEIQRVSGEPLLYKRKIFDGWILKFWWGRNNFKQVQIGKEYVLDERSFKDVRF